MLIFFYFCDLNKYQKSLLETMPAMKELVERVFPLTGDINLKALQKSSILRELSEINVETFEKENTRNVSGMRQMFLRFLFTM